MLVLQIGADDYRSSTPSGWTLAINVGATEGSFHEHTVYIKKATGSETSVAYVIGSASKSTYRLGWLSNIDQTTQIDGSTAAKQNTNTGSATDYTTPSSGTTSAGRKYAVAFMLGHTTGVVYTSIGTYLNSYAEIAETLSAGTQPFYALGQGALAFDGGGTTSSGCTFSQASISRSGMILVFNVAAGGGGTTTTKVMSDALSLSDVALDVAMRSRIASDALVASDERISGARRLRQQSDTLATSDDFFDPVRRVRVAEDAAVLSDTIVQVRRFVRRMDEAISLADAVTKTLSGGAGGLVVTKVMSDGVELTDNAGQRWTMRVRQSSDAITLTDALIRTALRIRSMDDDLTLDDGTVRVRRMRRFATDTLDVSDELIRTLQLGQVSPTNFVFGSQAPPFVFGIGEWPFEYSGNSGPFDFGAQ